MSGSLRATPPNGTRDTRDRSRDVWRVVHDLFDAENPSSEHLRPPCCEHELPVLDQSELDVRPEQVVHPGDGCLSPDGLVWSSMVVGP
jgi:hypothetical protein